MNNHLKKSHRIITIAIVFLLLSTILSSVVSSETISSYLSNNDSEDENRFERLFKKLLDAESIKERLAKLKERLLNIRDRLSQLKEDRFDSNEITLKTTSTSPFIESLRTYFTLRSSSS